MDLNSSYLFVFEKQFEEKYLNKQNNQRVRLCNAKNPVCIDHSPFINSKDNIFSSSDFEHASKISKSRVYREDDINSEAFKSMAIATFSKVNESKSLENGFLFSKNEDCVIFYRFGTNSIPAPKVCEIIEICSNLHFELFYKSSPIPLLSWFRKGGKLRVKEKSVMELKNFPAYVRLMAEENSSAIEDEIHQLRFKKKPIYSSSLLRYSLTLSYT